MLCDITGQTSEYLGNSEEINSPGTNIFELPSINFHSMFKKNLTLINQEAIKILVLQQTF